MSQLADEFHYQIGDRPMRLVISKVNGAPRVSFLLFKSPTTGEVLQPPHLLHLGTFREDNAALAFVHFMDELTGRVNEAVEYYKALSEKIEPKDILAVTQQEPRHGEQN